MANRTRNDTASIKQSQSKVLKTPKDLELNNGKYPAPEIKESAKANGIQDFFYLEDLLLKIVREANDILQGDGCSIFLLDEETGRYVLRESTVMTPFIGKYSLDDSRNPDKSHCGITTRVVINGVSHCSADVRHDPYWHWFGFDEKGFPQTEKPEHCEVKHVDLLSLIAVPVRDDRGRVAGVLRVVRRRGRQTLTQQDTAKLESLVNDYSKEILGAVSLGKLLEIGSILDEKELCQKAAEVLTRMVEGKGCSIFLLEEKKSEDGQLVYRCKATTGLEASIAQGKYEPVSNPAEAFYKLPEDYKKGRMTAYVIHQKRNLALANLHSCDFRKEFGFSRAKGIGKYSENFLKDGKRTGTGPSMATPLFFRERFDPQTPAMGVIRLTRPQGDRPFLPDEQRRFFSFAERLSKTILQCRYIALLNDLSAATDKEEQFKRVVSEVPKLIGGKGCSVFAGYPLLELKATSGRLEEPFSKGEINPYDPTDEKTRGYTGASAFFKRVIVYNNGDQRQKLMEEGLKGSGRSECELDEKPPSRFLAVPILAESRAVGVIRIPKTREESPFSSDDISMLKSIADHLGRIIQTANANLLGNYFDRNLLDIILREPSLLSTRSRWVTICFWDIRGFSRFCEHFKAHPTLIADFIKQYCDLAAKTIFEHDGVLDKFIGDGVMALFGVPVPEQNVTDKASSINAVLAACALRSKFAKLIETWKPKWELYIPQIIDIGLGCGIHTGEVLVGIFETEVRHQYTALGPSVNLASRIEAHSEPGQILISQTTARRVESEFNLDQLAEPIKNIKNIDGSFRLYEVNSKKHYG